MAPTAITFEITSKNNQRTQVTQYAIWSQHLLFSVTENFNHDYFMNWRSFHKVHIKN